MDNDFLQTIIDRPLVTVAAYYASCLEGNDKASTFIKEELKLTIEQAHNRGIGFADRSLGKQIPHKRTKVGREVREILESRGVYKANGRETLRGCVTVPIIDQGTVIGIRGYKLDPQAAVEAVIVVGEESGEQRAASVEGEATAGEGNCDAAGTPYASAADANDDDLHIADGQIVFRRDDRRYRIQGLEKNASACTLKISLMASRDGLVHLDSLDLVKARSRASFVKAAATELYVEEDLIKRDIGQLLLKVEALQAERLAKPKRPEAIQLTEDEEREALELLRSPQLLERIIADITACGMVGEATGKLAGYLAATSRRLKNPLALLIQSSSSAGKTSLMEAVLAMMPPEDQLRLSGMTGQSLFYLDSDDIRHKILAISEEKGVAEATYALKLLQSERKLARATVGHDDNGRAATQKHTVEGPVQLFLTTTAMEVDEELVNRCLVLSVDESREQTSAIQTLQRQARTWEGFQAAEQAEHLRRLHQNAQRLLRPLAVFNPYAPQLTFGNGKTRLRRDHEKYLTLIDTIALLHQHQRTIHRLEVPHDDASRPTEYINVQRSDIAAANRIFGELLGRSLDELSPQTRNLLDQLHVFVASKAEAQDVPRAAFRFTRSDIRQAIGWSDFQVRTHLNKLVELEYVLVLCGGFGKQYAYELLYAGEDREGEPFLVGLSDPAGLSEPPPQSAPTPQTSSIAPVTSSIG